LLLLLLLLHCVWLSFLQLWRTIICTQESEVNPFSVWVDFFTTTSTFFSLWLPSFGLGLGLGTRDSRSWTSESWIQVCVALYNTYHASVLVWWGSHRAMLCQVASPASRWRGDFCLLLTLLLLYFQGKAAIEVPDRRNYTAMMCGLTTCKASVTELLIEHGLTMHTHLSVCRGCWVESGVYPVMLTRTSVTRPRPGTQDVKTDCEKKAKAALIFDPSVPLASRSRRLWFLVSSHLPPPPTQILSPCAWMYMYVANLKHSKSLSDVFCVGEALDSLHISLSTPAFRVKANDWHCWVYLRPNAWTRLSTACGLCVGADVNVHDDDGETCLHMILKLIDSGKAGSHDLADMFNTTHIPLVFLSISLFVPGHWDQCGKTKSPL